MGRAGIEIALREAGVGRSLSIALAADLAEGRDGSAGDPDEVGSHVGPRRIHASRTASSSEMDGHWGQLPITSDADVCTRFGDLCGRQVA